MLIFTHNYHLLSLAKYNIRRLEKKGGEYGQ
nr:MAG TPA: hypothetical protein [Caudoviricetes sp.]